MASYYLNRVIKHCNVIPDVGDKNNPYASYDRIYPNEANYKYRLTRIHNTNTEEKLNIRLLQLSA